MAIILIFCRSSKVIFKMLVFIYTPLTVNKHYLFSHTFMNNCRIFYDSYSKMKQHLKVALFCVSLMTRIIEYDYLKNNNSSFLFVFLLLKRNFFLFFISFSPFIVWQFVFLIFNFYTSCKFWI